MKNFGIMLGLAITLVGCSTSPQSTYEKAIADYVQTNKRGTWTDLQFEIVTLEATDMTVADSLEIMRSEFEAQRAEAVESEKKNLQYWLGIISDDPKSREVGRYNENIASINLRIDSLNCLTSQDILRYEGLAPDEVLAIRAECGYSYVIPGSDTRQERTEIFVLSLDGKEVIGKMKKEN